MQTIQKLKQQLTTVAHRLQMVFTLARTSTEVNDSGVIRLVQGLLGYNQIGDNTNIMQQYGFASNLPIGTDVAVVCVNGNRSVRVILGSNHQSYTIKNLGNGSVALYDMFNNKIVLSSTGISLTDLTGNSIITTPTSVKVHAVKSYQWDVQGYGQRITWTSGSNYTIDNYVTGATVTTNNHPIAPPGPP